ncbi:DUF262 domain-containing protein [Roseateles sp. DAIF2]|uniref:DUF262 domain-containing protein n=1 Tax=Roseateles sp. DAIF2 TaxID=2714952 RepID=UPI0018A2E16A|nr:DUF262 domain-containing protein [Roseateles sp. DAIF2]QPF72691.1 DUF262 domain-containing protein [Roseateles sp. DAIF2]
MTKPGKTLAGQASMANILERFLKAQDRLVYQAADLSLSSLSGMLSSAAGGKSAIDLEPDFQRRKRWTKEKQSALIESFLMNVPVPPIYLAEDAYGQYSVVDGKQRLTAIHAFMSGTLKLKGLETFKEIEDFGFEELPSDLQNALNIRPYVRVVTLLKQSDPSLKFEVFTRLNRGGEQMLPQELRKVAYRGGFSDLIFELAASPFLRQQLKIQNDQSSAYVQMEDAEYILRFFALSESWKHFSGALRDELDNCMVRHAKDEQPALDSAKARFNRALNACQYIWGDNAFQRYTGTGWRDQFLGGVFDAEMIAVNELTDTELQTAMTNRQQVVAGTSQLFANADFSKVVRQGTNTPSFVRARVTAVYNLLQNP